MREPGAPHYPNFDVLRLLLALSVVYAHCYNSTGPKLTVVFPNVPGFLALSGFMVLQSYERSHGWPHFAWKRFLRVVPAFLASLAGMFFLNGIAGVWGSIRCWLTLGLGPLTGNGVLWSLGWEEILYGLLAVLYALGAYRRPFIVWLLFVSSMTFRLAAAPHLSHGIDRAAPLLPAFFAGNLGYLYRDRLLQLNRWVPCVILVLGLAAYTFVAPKTTLERLHDMYMVMAIGWFGLAGPTLPIKLPGDLSYGTYLFHMLVAELLRRHGIVERAPLIVGTTLLSLVVAALSWWIIEKPALSLKSRWRTDTARNRLDREGARIVCPTSQ